MAQVVVPPDRVILARLDYLYLIGELGATDPLLIYVDRRCSILYTSFHLIDDRKTLDLWRFLGLTKRRLAVA